ncbi:MAG: anion permease [Actinomycetota bacterium]
MDHILIATIATVGLAILFDFTNGFHDAANSTSTVIATRSLSPRKAVALAALFNFLPAFVVGTAVANTITRTINLGDLPAVGADVVPIGVRLTLAALIGATLWNFFTWRRGLPSSSGRSVRSSGWISAPSFHCGTHIAQGWITSGAYPDATLDRACVSSSRKVHFSGESAP